MKEVELFEYHGKTTNVGGRKTIIDVSGIRIEEYVDTTSNTTVVGTQSVSEVWLKKVLYFQIADPTVYPSL